MTQDYNFCIVIGPRSNHANTNAYSKNPMGETKDIEDIEDEIQDLGTGVGISNGQMEKLERLMMHLFHEAI